MVVGDGFTVVCIGGVSNGGKTSLLDYLRSRYRDLKYIKQDKFFLDPDDPRHVWVEGPTFRCQNWEIKESLDFVKLKEKVLELTRSNETPENQLIVLEGHLLYADADIVKWSDLNYFFTLTKEQCWERRKDRVYDPPDPPGYFDAIIYPEYIKHKEFVEKNVRNVKFIDGSKDPREIRDLIESDINRIVKLKPH